MEAVRAPGSSRGSPRLGVLLVARFLVAIACVAVLLALEGGEIFSSPRFKYAYFLLLIVCVSDLLYIPLFRRLDRPPLQAGLQAVVDLLAVTALVYLTGGVYSPFALLYFGAVVAVSSFFAAPGALLFGAFSAGLLLGVGALFHAAFRFGWPLGLVSPQTLKDHAPFGDVAGATVLPALGFLGVAFLASRLAATASRERVVMEEVLQGMGDGVATVDPLGRIVFINPAARALLDLPPGPHPLGRTLPELFREIGARGFDVDPAALPASESFTVDVPPGNGPSRSLHVTISPVADAGGKARGAVALLRDLTWQRRVEEAVRRADRLQDISEMSAGIAHEIRNPLASIRGSIQELHTASILSDDDKRLMKVILRECDRLNGIVEKFLEFAGRQAMNQRPCDLGTLLDEVSAALDRHPARGASCIRVEKEGDLAVRADPEGLRQVLFNLGLNGLEAMSGGGSLRFRACFRASYPRPEHAQKPAPSPVEGVAVDVSDTGRGIAPEILGKIFHPFFTTKPKGTGMGLSLVHRIVDAHRGTVKVDSIPGTGTTFSVWIPRTPPAPPEKA